MCWNFEAALDGYARETSKKLWREWAEWDKKQFAHEMALFENGRLRRRKKHRQVGTLLTGPHTKEGSHPQRMSLQSLKRRGSVW
jgi:hypothetical protein